MRVVRQHRNPGRLDGLLVAAAWILLALGLVPYLHGYWWVLELPAHFRLHLVGAAALVAVLAAWRGQRLAAITGFVASAACGAIVLAVPTGHASIRPGVTIASQNLYFRNADLDRLSAAIDQADPDILVLQEYTPEWHALLAAMAERYEAVIAVPRPGAFGIAIFSKLPIATSEIIYPGDSGAPFIQAEFSTPQFSAHVIAVHFPAPTRHEWFATRQRQLSALAAHLQEMDGPFVAIGDFNNTPAAPTLKNFVTATGAHLAAPTWLATWPSALGRAGIPIDLAVGSGDVRFSGLTRLADVGSDHRGIRVSVAVEQHVDRPPLRTGQ